MQSPGIVHVGLFGARTTRLQGGGRCTGQGIEQGRDGAPGVGVQWWIQTTSGLNGGHGVQPVLDKMHGWLPQKQDQVPPSTALGKAIAFALGQWPKLIRYLDHAQLTPDNNSCEQAIRPSVIGRRNWLFSGNPRGAAARALLYSLIETAKANRPEPFWYLRELFEKLPVAHTRADHLALLPTARPPLSPP